MALLSIVLVDRNALLIPALLVLLTSGGTPTQALAATPPTHVTISHNHADCEAGGLGLSVDATTTLQHTLIAKNSGGMTAVDCAGAFTSAGHNLIGSGCGSSLGGSDLAGVDPKLETLSLNGGETSTVGLAADSPALNAGGSTVGVDQRRVARDGVADIVTVTPTPTPTVTPQPTASPTPTPTATPGVPNTGETERVYLPVVVR